MKAAGPASDDLRPQTLPIFVYGTLQRGEQRAGAWPRRAQRIEWATTAGQLHDLGPFPALVPGSDRVQGELRYLSAEDLAVTLDVLDAIEGFRQAGPDLYVRRVVDGIAETGRRQPAYAYFYARPAEIAYTRLVRPDPRGLVHWHRRRGSEN